MLSKSSIRKLKTELRLFKVDLTQEQIKVLSGKDYNTKIIRGLIELRNSKREELKALEKMIAA